MTFGVSLSAAVLIGLASASLSLLAVGAVVLLIDIVENNQMRKRALSAAAELRRAISDEPLAREYGGLRGLVLRIDEERDGISFGTPREWEQRINGAAAFLKEAVTPVVVHLAPVYDVVLDLPIDSLAFLEARDQQQVAGVVDFFKSQRALELAVAKRQRDISR